MKPLSISTLAVLVFCSLGVLNAQADTIDEPSPLSESCGCPTTTYCNKTASGCQAVCREGQSASCTCAEKTGGCYAGGPYGSFKNSCRCI